jgi:hypothetical protein
MVDTPLAILNIPGCSHVFGAACVKQMASDPVNGRHQRCPCCRTEWWHEPDPYDLDVTDDVKHKVSEDVARTWQTDYNTARNFLYNEPEYADAYAPIELEQLLSKLTLSRMINGAMDTEAIQKRIQRLQEKCVITIAEIAYCPRKVLVTNSTVDPFIFNNYHLHVRHLGFAVRRTLESTRGSQLWQMYRDVVHGTDQVADQSCLVAIEKEWMGMFPEDQRDWVRLILNILWIADLIASEDER